MREWRTGSTSGMLSGSSYWAVLSWAVSSRVALTWRDSRSSVLCRAAVTRSPSPAVRRLVPDPSASTCTAPSATPPRGPATCSDAVRSPKASGRPWSSLRRFSVTRSRPTAPPVSSRSAGLSETLGLASPGRGWNLRVPASASESTSRLCWASTVPSSTTGKPVSRSALGGLPSFSSVTARASRSPLRVAEPARAASSSCAAARVRWWVPGCSGSPSAELSSGWVSRPARESSLPCTVVGWSGSSIWPADAMGSEFSGC